MLMTETDASAVTELAWHLDLMCFGMDVVRARVAAAFREQRSFRRNQRDDSGREFSLNSTMNKQTMVKSPRNSA